MIAALRQQLDCGAESLLLVDASNAFNTLNRRFMLHNVSVLCPPFAPCVVNYYEQCPAVHRGEVSCRRVNGGNHRQGDLYLWPYTHTSIIPKTIGLCVRLRSGDKHHLRKSADQKAQISTVSGTNAFLICAFRSADFLR